ncbi:MAG TPA: hypothetical protein VN605_06435 [Thermoanaerobaculia bacterium]|nr:hypothetical protein [Thermoanaerobaculia bacterium]
MASPLTLIMPVIPGKTFLEIAATLGKYGPQLDAALRGIGTVHYARTLLLDSSVPNLQPDLTKPSTTYLLAIITEFDGSFEDYIQDFVAKVGEVFDALLQFVVGGAAITPVADHVQEFEDFLAKNNASQHMPNVSLFQAYTATVQKIIAAVGP